MGTMIWFVISFRIPCFLTGNMLASQELGEDQIFPEIVYYHKLFRLQCEVSKVIFFFNQQLKAINFTKDIV